MLNQEGRVYLEGYSPMKGFTLFREFVKYLMYRNLANYDAMVLIEAVKGGGKSSSALMIAKEWMNLQGRKFDPERHFAYTNQDMMTKIDMLGKWEVLVADEAVRFACLSKDTKIDVIFDDGKKKK